MEEKIQQTKKPEEDESIITYAWSCKGCGSTIKTIENKQPNNCSCGIKEFEYLGFKYREDLIKSAGDKFKSPKIIEMIKEEIGKYHLGDDNLKMTMFLIEVSGLLNNQKRRQSLAITSESSEGKDNMIRSTLKQIPNNAFMFLTKATQATIEDDMSDIRIIAFSEVNAGRENGSNKDLIETIKQKTEGGTDSIKKDLRDGMKSARREKSEQASVIYGTTETGMDEEMRSRFICGGIKTDVKRIKRVNDNTLDSISDLDKLLSDSKDVDNWVRIGLNGFFNKEEQFEVWIPYAKFLKEVEGEIIFDNNDARSQRDLKRILGLTCAMTYVRQLQRKTKDYKGTSILISEPEDFIDTLKITQEFFNQSYTGIDHRLSEVINAMEDITKETGKVWIARIEIQKKIGKVLNTIKEYCKELGLSEGKGLIEGRPGFKLREEIPGSDYNIKQTYYRKAEQPIKRELIYGELDKILIFLNGKMSE